MTSIEDSKEPSGEAVNLSNDGVPQLPEKKTRRTGYLPPTNGNRLWNNATSVAGTPNAGLARTRLQDTEMSGTRINTEMPGCHSQNSGIVDLQNSGKYARTDEPENTGLTGTRLQDTKRSVTRIMNTGLPGSHSQDIVEPPIAGKNTDSNEPQNTELVGSRQQDSERAGTRSRITALPGSPAQNTEDPKQSLSETDVKGRKSKPTRERERLDDKREKAFQAFRELAARQRNVQASHENMLTKKPSQTFPRSIVVKVGTQGTSPPAMSNGRSRVQSPVKDECQVIEMDPIRKDGSRGDQQTGKERSIHMSTSVISSTSSDGGICRICHEGESKEDLLSPCHCTGTVGLLHLSCMEKWFGSSNTTKCELCHFEYTVDRKAKPFPEWLRHPSGRHDHHNLVCDVVCFFILTPLAAISSWLCLAGAQHYAMWTGRWEVPGLISLTVMLITIYLIWCVVVVRYHYRVWRHWKHHNQIVRIRAVKKAMHKKGDSNVDIGSPQSACSHTSTDNTSADDNNNNFNRNSVVYDEEDVVVEVSGGAGQRESYRILSESSNLLRSPARHTFRSHHSLSSLSPRRQFSSSPQRPGRRRNRTRSDCSSIESPLLENPSGSSTPYVSRSLMADPLFYGSHITGEPESLASPGQSFLDAFDSQDTESFGLSMSDTLLNEGRCKHCPLRETPV